MNIICDSCQGKFSIPDDKIPEDRSATTTCPRCKSKIVIQPKQKSSGEGLQAGAFDFMEEDDAAPSTPASANIQEASEADRFRPDPDSSMEKPFDFIEEEGRTALICESSQEILSQIKHVLDYMEYHVTEAANTRDALKQMRYHDYDLIIVNENFDTPNPDANGVLMFISRMPINVRRQIFVAMLSKRYKTLDYMMAFVKSVNMIVNERNAPEFETILQRGVADTDLLYKTLRDALKRAGRV